MPTETAHPKSTGITRRGWLGLTGATVWAVSSPALGATWRVTELRPSTIPDPSTWEDSPARGEAEALYEAALAAETLEEEERAWSAVTDRVSMIEERWVPPLLARAFTNRGTVYARQRRFTKALADYNAAIALAPYGTDAVLNRGLLMAAQGQYQEACSDYQAVLTMSPDNGVAWNSLGDATAGMGRWREAAQYYAKAGDVAPELTGATVSYALAMYQAGSDPKAAVRMLNSLQNPDSSDAAAAYAAVLWTQGDRREARAVWAKITDDRYRDPSWLTEQRAWPPAVLSSLQTLAASPTLT